MPDDIQFQTGFELPLALSVREQALARLILAGYDLSLAVEDEGKKARTISFYWQEKRRALRVLAELKAMRVRGARVFWRIHRKSDWSSRWKKGWKPFALTRRFHVIPLWQDDRSCPRGKEPIYLDTTNAFGTGLHETTRFTAQIIESLEGKFASFLDVGTGSGILAVVALKCGAEKCVGIDIDPSAVKVARRNLKANGLSCALKVCDVKDFMDTSLHVRRAAIYRGRRRGKDPFLDVRQAAWRAYGEPGPDGRFDLVAANLVSPDLIEFCDKIMLLVAPGGHLVISGISLKSMARVKRAFRRKAKLLKVIKGREWSAMLFHCGHRGR